MTVNEKKKLPIWHKIPTCASPFHIEIDKISNEMSTLVSGVIGISEFSDGFVSLKFRGMEMNIFGEALSLGIYENKSVEIIGKIMRFEYKYVKD